MSLIANVKGMVGQILPTVMGNGSTADVRVSKYGELVNSPVLTSKQNLSLEGSYFIATNPTMGTGIAMTTSITTFAETAGAVGVMFLLRNTLTAGDTAKRIVMDYLKMKIIQVPTSATHWDYAVAVDDNPARYTSGGSVITPTNPNGGASAGSIASLYFGALTTGVPTNRRIVGRGTLRGIIPTTFDTMTIAFGGDHVANAILTSGSAKYLDVTSPVILAPGQNMAITMWGTSNAAAPSFEFEAGWIER